MPIHTVLDTRNGGALWVVRRTAHGPEHQLPREQVEREIARQGYSPRYILTHSSMRVRNPEPQLRGVFRWCEFQGFSEGSWCSISNVETV